VSQQNPYWYKIAHTTPRLRNHAKLHRQEQRGMLWYVMQDQASGRYYRFTPQAYYFIGLLDGVRTVQNALQHTEQVLGEDAPSQADVIRLLYQLHAADALDGKFIPDPLEADTRGRTSVKRKRMQQYLSPLAVRVPLLDPEKILVRMRPLARLIFSLPGVVVWLLVLIYGTSVAVVNFDALTDNFADRILAAENLLIILIAFPLLKLCHEFGHGLAVTRWGGEVHEMGVMFLVFMPIPYVDASSSTAFRNRWQRAWVSSAGMYVEMFLAALAVIFWAMIEPGIVRSILFNVALIGSVTTIVFNLNPLLRFDGYYIFSDLIDIPNLGSRGNKYFQYLCQRYLLGLPDAVSPVTAKGESGWLFVYPIASFIYRIFVVSLIAMFVISKFFIIGVLLVMLSIGLLIGLPLFKLMKFLLFSDRVHSSGWRAYTGVLIISALLFVALFKAPFPLTTYAEGVVWVDEAAELTAAESGFIQTVGFSAGSQLRPGDRILGLENNELTTEMSALEARLHALNARYQAELVNDRVAAQITDEEIEHIRQRLDELVLKTGKLNLLSHTEGTLLISNVDDLPGRFLKRGEMVGFVVDPQQVRVRTLIPQSDVGHVRERIESISLLLSDNMNTELPAELLREVPAADDSLPSPALATTGGGRIALSPTAGSDKPKTLNKMFHFELGFKQPPLLPRVGQRVHVKFMHGYQPIGYQLLDKLKQLFLKEIRV
jgi:putative peptide zinc metalloprotease protein